MIIEFPSGISPPAPAALVIGMVATMLIVAPLAAESEREVLLFPPMAANGVPGGVLALDAIRVGLSDTLNRGGRFQVEESAAMPGALDGLSGRSMEVGGARIVLLAGVSRYASVFYLGARVVELETAEVLSSATASGENIRALHQKAAVVARQLAAAVSSDSVGCQLVAVDGTWPLHWVRRTWRFEGKSARVHTTDRSPRVLLPWVGDPKGKVFVVRLKVDNGKRLVEMGRTESKFLGFDAELVDTDKPNPKWRIEHGLEEVKPGLWSLEVHKELKPGEYGVLVIRRAKGDWLYPFAVDK